MRAFRLFCLVLALSGAAVAQERGSIPPGQSRDGAAPADGAIKGGAILPGETAGMPDKERVENEKRCDELRGTLREDCLKQQPSDTRTRLPAPADSGAGSSSYPR